MPSYKAPVEDMMFIIRDVLDINQYTHIPGFADLSPELIEAILLEGAKLSEEVIQPLNQIGDEVGCTRHEDGSVTTPPGYKEAYKAYCDGGWLGMLFDPAYGGQGMPKVIGTAFGEMMVSANMSFNMYPGLTMGAAASIQTVGSEEQKQTYLTKMISGEWTGTMCLTEAHCGTDLALMRSKAEPQDDGTYKVTGSKIFISSGEHDLSENIVHLVLAKAPGGPKSIKGLSLFIIPKFIPDENGNVGERNGVTCGSIEEKMGIHSNSTCVLNFDGATGYLIGELHDGMKPMFIMMNEARLGVGIQGLGQAVVSYQNAAIYARDRLQMRSISGAKFPDQPADPIIVHPDVRRNLLDCKTFIEGARALAFWTAMQVGFEKDGADEADREAASDFIDLLTPVIKGVFTDKAFDSTVQAQQVFGGHGYIKEWGMEQFVRDARITQIYEGTNGIQALDLVGRKLGANGGRAIQAYFKMMTEFMAENDGDDMKEFIGPLGKAVEHLQRASMWLMQNGISNPDNAGAASTHYMHLLGLVAMAHMWAMMAKTVLSEQASGSGNPDFLEAKLKTARYFFSHKIINSRGLLGQVEAGADTLMALDAEQF
jgi:hypothetical protein